MPKRRRIIIIAGPNGAGKTTFAREYLLKEADCPEFINVDLIAAGLSPFDPDRAAIRAGRLMLSHTQCRRLYNENHSTIGNVVLALCVARIATKILGKS